MAAAPLGLSLGGGRRRCGADPPAAAAGFALARHLRRASLLTAVLAAQLAADILPPAEVHRPCSAACAAGCEGGKDECCPGTCSQQPCGHGHVSVFSFRCLDGSGEHFSFGGHGGHGGDSDGGGTRCCVPQCKSDKDCTGGEVCGGMASDWTCRRPMCNDLGGSCRAPEGRGPSACPAGEEERAFEERCDSGCGYWRGRCGQACCVPAPPGGPAAVAGGVTKLAAAPQAPGEDPGGRGPGAASASPAAFSAAELVGLGGVAAAACVLYRWASPAGLFSNSAARGAPVGRPADAAAGGGGRGRGDGPCE